MLGPVCDVGLPEIQEKLLGTGVNYVSPGFRLGLFGRGPPACLRKLSGLKIASSMRLSQTQPAGSRNHRNNEPCPALDPLSNQP